MKTYVISKTGSYRNFEDNNGYYGQRAKRYIKGTEVTFTEEYGEYLVSQNLVYLAPVLVITEDKKIIENKPTSEPVPKINATSSARKLANENNFDLSVIIGTGSNGKIIKSDVENYMGVSENVRDS